MQTTIERTESAVDTRDRIAAWLPVAEEILLQMDRNDSRYIEGKTKWDEQLARYEELCKEHPETPR